MVNAKKVRLDDNIFRRLGLSKLSSIKIVDSEVEILSSRAFHGLHELYSLNLTNCGITQLEPDTFADNKKLTLLSLSGNSLRNVVNSKSFASNFINSTTIQELDMSNCNLPWLLDDTFAKLPNLMYLNLAGNKLTFGEAPETSKVFLNADLLEEIDLSDNQIKNLSGRIFNENLETLRLRNNPMVRIKDFNLPQLQVLDLSECQFSLIDADMFRGIGSLSSLNLSSNGIVEIYPRAFDNLIDLRFIDLTHNLLTFLPDNVFQNNDHLDVIKISNNPNLMNLPRFHSNLSSFTTYMFEAVNCGLLSLDKHTFAEMPSMAQLNLAQNSIKDLKYNIFWHMRNLISLDLSNNKINKLDTRIFKNSKSLNKLLLSGNPLKTVEAKVFLPLSLLNWLDLSDCGLNQLWLESNVGAKDVLSSLKFLNISKNHLRSIRVAELEVSSRLRTIDFSQNPIQCDVDFRDLITYMGDNNISPGEPEPYSSDLSEFYPQDDVIEEWNVVARKICGDAYDEDDLTKIEKMLDKKIQEVDKDVEKYSKMKIEQESNKNKEKSLEDDDDDDSSLDDDDDNDDYVYEYEYDSKGIKNNKDKVSLKEAILLMEKMQNKMDDSSTVFSDLDDDLLEAEILQSANAGSHESIFRGRYHYVWPMLLLLLIVLTVLFVVGKIVHICTNNRQRSLKYQNIITAVNHKIVKKKDCGLVYQPLSEEIRCPPTPIVTRYPSYLSSPFHHEKITPEQV